jgi:hypothetical protein
VVKGKELWCMVEVGEFVIQEFGTYRRSFLLSFVLTLVPYAMSSAYRCPHHKDELHYLY